MNTRFRNLGTTAGLSAAALFLAAGAAFGANETPAVLNQTPATAIGAAGDPAVLVLYPRKIFDPSITDTSATAYNTAGADDATDVVTLRNRSIAVLPAPATTVDNNAVIAFGGINLGGDALAANSRIIFFNAADVADTTDASLLFNLPASQYVALSALGVADADLVAGTIDDAQVELTLKGAAASMTIQGQLPDYQNYDYAIIMLADGPLAADVIEWSEIICVDGNPEQVVANQVVAGPDSTFGTLTSVFLAMNQQIGDDNDGPPPAGQVDSPNDTDLAAITDGSDFFVRVAADGTDFRSLEAFLNDTTFFNPAMTVAGAQFSDDEKQVLELVFDRAMTSGELDTLRTREIRPGTGVTVAGVTGTIVATGNGAYRAIGEAADITFGTAQLLQGTGQTGFGNGGTQVWVAIDFSDNINNAGDNNQFELLNADGDVIATSNLVQTTLPTNVQVLGIDDANLNGTADDNVIEVAGDRLFARFTLADGDDSINSDATWSDDGQDDIANRDTRSAISVRIVDGFGGTTATTSLGGVVDAASTATLSDLARPVAIAFETRAGETGDFCEFVDTLDLIFDETVATNANTSTFTFLGYASGATISDLTTGLGAGLSIPSIDIVTTATVNDRRLTPGSLALTTNFVNNDTATLGAPVVPVDGTANDGTTSILSGTGDEAYIIAHRNAAVADAGGRGAVALGTFNGMNELTGGFETVSDGAAPALMAANVNDDLDTVTAGFSENVVNVLGTDEAESLFVIMENDAVGRRFNIENGDADFNGDNTVDIDLPASLDEDLSLDPGYNLSVFNPGHDIEDADGNAIDPNVAKTKMVLITAPAAAFKEEGVAIVDDDNDKVVEIRLMVTGPVDLNDGGTLADLADRFFIRGDDFNGAGGNDGDSQELGGLIEDIEIGTTPNSDGCYTITLTLMDGMPIPQEDFYVEYADGDDLTAPAGTFLVTPNDNGEVALASSVIYVRVLRAPVNEGDDNSPSGNPLTMTIVGSVDLNGVNALGTHVSAWVWDADEGNGTMSFTYKGVVHTTTIDGVANGEVRYFHPQLLGDGLGAVDPMGIVNRKPELDITATVTLTREGNENGNATDIEQEVLVYQELNNLGVTSIIKPIQITFRDDPTCPGRFTFTGAGITNGVVTYPGEFENIGETVVTSPALAGEDAETGARPYTLHTYGEKSFKGMPVVIVVEPEEFFAPDAECFLANNMLAPVASSPNARALTFMSDIDRTGSSALPRVFNIDSANVTAFDLDDYEQDDWAILPIPTNQGDLGTTGNLPNRVSTGTTALATQANIPAGISARGAFVVLNGACQPELLDIDLALALDNRGVFCGDICNLTRVATGYAYAVSADNLNGRTWFTFGPRFSSGASLAVANNTANGGWNLLANLRNAAVAPGSFGGQVNITMMDETGVRVWANGFTSTNDLDSIGVNEGVLVNSTGAFNSTP